MDKPTEAPIKEFWEFYLSKKVELREGFWDECGDFIEMQGNPYSPPHKTKALCYLDEDRELNENERKEYEKDFNEGKLKVEFIPQRAQVWEELPPIDLNNLFQWAVPKAIKAIMAEHGCGEYDAYKRLLKEWLLIGYDALDLFWAIDKARKNQ